MTRIKNNKIEGIIGEIIDQYSYADKSNRPWIIGFSGGKKYIRFDFNQFLNNEPN